MRVSRFLPRKGGFYICLILLCAPAASAFLAEQLATLIVAVSHKHTRLPIPYRKGETVSCLSWGSFIDVQSCP